VSVDVQLADTFDADEAARFAGWFEALVGNVTQVVRGKDDVVRLVLQCMFAGGHALIEDNPGTAKTTLAKAIAKSIDGIFSRIQFTPDLLPSDVTGVQIYDPDRKEFRFRQGPVAANIVLADEINRASPKTQSALLEAMAERQVTVDGEGFPLPEPFLVIATQNSVEMHGTYPLPEAQLDRFSICTSIGYPDRGSAIQILRETRHQSGTDGLTTVLSAEHVQQMIDAAQNVFVADSLLGYIADIGEAAREVRQPEIRVGISQRALGQLKMVAQSRAASQGRHYVVVDDIKAVAPAVFGHRLLLRPEAAIKGLTVGALLDRILSEIPSPRERPGG
jgi:MoxR-like ATPase